MRIDKFILRHIDYLRGKLILASQNINQSEADSYSAPNNDKVINSSSNSICLSTQDSQDNLRQDNQMIIEGDSHHDSWNEVENWRGLHKTADNMQTINEPTTSTHSSENRKRATYLNDFPH